MMKTIGVLLLVGGLVAMCVGAPIDDGKPAVEDPAPEAPVPEAEVTDDEHSARVKRALGDEDDAAATKGVKLSESREVPPMSSGTGLADKPNPTLDERKEMDSWEVLPAKDQTAANEGKFGSSLNGAGDTSPFGDDSWTSGGTGFSEDSPSDYDSDVYSEGSTYPEDDNTKWNSQANIDSLTNFHESDYSKYADELEADPEAMSDYRRHYQDLYNDPEEMKKHLIATNNHTPESLEGLEHGELLDRLQTENMKVVDAHGMGDKVRINGDQPGYEQAHALAHALKKGVMEKNTPGSTDGKSIHEIHTTYNHHATAKELIKGGVKVHQSEDKHDAKSLNSPKKAKEAKTLHKIKTELKGKVSLLDGTKLTEDKLHKMDKKPLKKEHALRQKKKAVVKDAVAKAVKGHPKGDPNHPDHHEAQAHGAAVKKEMKAKLNNAQAVKDAHKGLKGGAPGKAKPAGAASPKAGAN